MIFPSLVSLECAMGFRPGGNFGERQSHFLMHPFEPGVLILHKPHWVFPYRRVDVRILFKKLPKIFVFFPVVGIGYK